MIKGLALVLIVGLARNILITRAAISKPAKDLVENSELGVTGLAELAQHNDTITQSYPKLRPQRHKFQLPDDETDYANVARNMLTNVGGLNSSDGSFLKEECQYGAELGNQDLDATTCGALRVFNQKALDERTHSDMIDLVSYCACQLDRMYTSWEYSFDKSPDTRRVFTMVNQVINKHQAAKLAHPDFLWSDAEVINDGVSIYTATKDYFYRQSHDKLTPTISKEHSKDEVWQLVTRFCLTVSQDPFRVYRYMENIKRASASVFYNLLLFSEQVTMVYEASKACKLLLMDHMSQYKLRARESNDEILNPLISRQDDQDYVTKKTNQDYPTNVDTMLRSSDLSALLLDCRNSQQDQEDNLDTTNQPVPNFNCSLLSSKLPKHWMEKSGPTRSRVALKCGCQLLGYHSNWTRILHDPKVEVMSKALTNYMNQNFAPNFADTPIWAIFDWCEGVMSKFNNRKFTQREVVKALSNDEDPLEAKSKVDLDGALELIRRACNYIVFNYNKGSKSVNSDEQNVVMTIKYLENLQTISPDPLFVFHLTLQDPDLFRLHSLAKMCKPFLR